MISESETLREAIIEDIKRFNLRKGYFPFLVGIFLHPGLRMVFLSRILGELRIRRGYRILTVPLVFLHLIMREFSGIQISYGLRAGGGFYIPHYGGIVINQDALIGNRCYLSHNTTIGRVHAGKKAGVPSIGDDVYIGPGAVILGNCCIGDNAAIAANSVVTSDIPKGSFAAGAPARVVSLTGAKEILGYETASNF